MLGLLITTLTHLYPHAADWYRLTTCAGLNFTHLFAQTSAINFWHAAVHEAANQRATLALITVAFTEYPHDAHLSDLYTFYEEQTHGE